MVNVIYIKRICMYNSKTVCGCALHQMGIWRSGQLHQPLKLLKTIPKGLKGKQNQMKSVCVTYLGTSLITNQISSESFCKYTPSELCEDVAPEERAEYQSSFLWTPVKVLLLKDVSNRNFLSTCSAVYTYISYCSVWVNNFSDFCHFHNRNR